MKKRSKLMLVLTAVITLILSFSAVEAFAITPTEAKEGVVVVIRDDGAYGSGFAIGKVGDPVEYIVTNNHVVNDTDNGIKYTTATVCFSLASGNAMTANVIYNDEAKDIAVLKLPEPTTQRRALVLCPMDYIDPDDEYAALGYPSNQVTDWPKYNVDDITITRGGIKKVDRLLDRDVYMLDLPITFGNSGGPLVNSDGEVVGINTFGASGENYAVVIDEMLKGIDTDRIPVQLHGSFPVLYAVIGGVILLIIIALVLVLVLRKKKNSGDDYYSTPYEGSEGYTEPQNESHTAPAPQPNRAGARLIALSGTLNGRKYSINGTMRMGRDSASCAIAFPVNTQGVSARHCEITYDGTVCYIKDLNSSYGTYTIDGKKLIPGQPQILKSGDKFYLAGSENTFEIRY